MNRILYSYRRNQHSLSPIHCRNKQWLYNLSSSLVVENLICNCKAPRFRSGFLRPAFVVSKIFSEIKTVQSSYM